MKASKVHAVLVRCMLCKVERVVRAGDTAKGDHPMCLGCLMPMIPVKAMMVPAKVRAR